MGHSRSTALAAATKAALAVAAAVFIAVLPADATAAAPGRLAYVVQSGNNGYVWVANSNGTNGRQLGVGDENTVSPNGNLVAVVASDSNGQSVVVYSVNGTLLARFPGAEGPLTFSSNSRYLVMQRSGLQVADLQAGTVTQVAKGQLQGASFAPSGSRLVYGLSKSEAFNAPVNLFTVNPNGTGRKQLTTNGRSANPVWGSKGIVFDRVTPRKNDAPISQIYVLNNGKTRQITNLKVPSLLTGLVPMYIASDGVQLVAAYSGQDTDQAWTVNLSTKKLVRLNAGKPYVTPWGISRNGKRVLVALGGFEGPPTGSVATIPFSGGKATILVRRAGLPSWNQ